MNPNSKVTALLPMKAISERVPNKNLKLFAGQPLYHVVMNVLLSCPFITKVIVNTDGDAIKADLLKNFPSVVIHNRPHELRGGLVPTNDILDFDISHCDDDIFLQTHCTNPMLTKETLEKAYGFFIENKATYDSLFSVTKSYNRFYSESGDPINHNPKELLRTQDLPPLLLENSCFYFFTRNSFNQHKNRIGESPFLYAINANEAIDIDEQDDFDVAESLYLRRIPTDS